MSILLLQEKARTSSTFAPAYSHGEYTLCSQSLDLVRFTQTTVYLSCPRKVYTESLNKVKVEYEKDKSVTCGILR